MGKAQGQVSECGEETGVRDRRRCRVGKPRQGTGRNRGQAIDKEVARGAARLAVAATKAQRAAQGDEVQAGEGRRHAAKAAEGEVAARVGEDVADGRWGRGKRRVGEESPGPPGQIGLRAKGSPRRRGVRKRMVDHQV